MSYTINPYLNIYVINHLNLCKKNSNQKLCLFNILFAINNFYFYILRTFAFSYNLCCSFIIIVCILDSLLIKQPTTNFNDK